MKIIGWNINGLRGKSMNLFTDKNTKFNQECDLTSCINKYNPDVVCLSETKCQDIHTNLLNLLPFKYNTSICSQAKKGYAGVAILSNLPFIDHGSIPLDDNDIEGRSRIVEFENVFLIYVYTPNSGGRFDYRIKWDEVILKYLETLNNNQKIVIYCGDLNVVHQYNDIYSNKILDNATYPGTLLEERIRFNNILNIGYSDIWRIFNPYKTQFTWWNPRTKARLSNSGWRIDYFLIRKKKIEDIKDVLICDDIYGSDHCPIYIETK